ncbi:hypothetical protein AJ79_01386 [Helicocarpus griseus UAMH5409]|uniref:Uncharacterized protein n=1 Tax=Helicocarpus griseus UAMH5409 TaxID=1447875 RepID=A0A2B7Y7Z6_9EURO|nr:hypothetical protein AJ79_01386 [Helicocarpus griseus UAMH5409]
MAPRKHKDLSDQHDPLLISSARLETEYEKALCQTNLIIGDEQNRSLRVRVLLADHDKDDLAFELEETKWHLERAERIGWEAEEQLKQAQNDLEYLRNSLRSNMSELQATAADSSKLLAEKHSLTREVASFKLEVEHLRSQNLSQQFLISEKMALERQLGSLEVELEGERRALEKARLKGLEQREADDRSSARLEELNKELARERRERERLEKDMKSEETEWARQRTVLENKLSTLRNKLRGSKDESRQSKESDDIDHPTILNDVVSSQREEDREQKRSASRFESDITIATPGAGAAPRKISRGPSIPGEKSAFSTTPFLNRTSTTAESSDTSESDSHAERTRRPAKRMEEGADKPDLPKSRKPANSRAKKAANQKRPAKARARSAMLESEAESEVSRPTKTQAESLASTANNIAGKKRRLLPKKNERTLFDDDVEFGDANKERRRVQSGFRVLGGGPLGLGAPGRRLGGGFAEISPLRRDIRSAKD